jgi:predicted outer membrane protein
MWKNLFLALLLVSLFAVYAIAEPPAVTPDNPGNAAPTGENMTPEQKSQQWQQNVARCLLLGNQEQVLMGQFAAERAQSPEVKQFAQSMVKSHNEWIAKLQQYAPNTLTTEELGKRAYAIQQQLQSENTTMPAATDTEGNMRKMMTTDGQHPMRMVAAMQQKMAENCLAYTQAELAQVDKDRFDHAYIGQQIFSHVATLAKLRTMAPYVSAELKPIIEQEEKDVRAQLDQAKNICKQFETKMMSQKGGTENR